MKTTHLLIALNCLIYAVMLAVGGAAGLRGFSSHTLLEFGGLYAPLVRDGEWWRMVTAVFIHITPIHLAMNMVALYQVGVVLEPHFGRWRFVALYLLCGLGGSAASLLWNWRQPITSAGASGAISGLIGAGAVVGHLLGGPHGKQFRDAMLRWAAVILVFGVFVPVDNAAHAGGFVVGLAAAWALDGGGRAARREAARKASRLGLETVVLLGVFVGGFALASRHRPDAMFVEEVVNAGVDKSKEGDAAAARALFARAVRMDPRDAIARYDLAAELADAGEWAGAEREARRATELDPSHKGSWLVLAESLDKQGRPAEAQAAFERYKSLGGAVGPHEGGTE